MGLIRAILSRMLQAGVVALAVASLCFVALQSLPGDLALRIAATRYGEDRMTAPMVDDLRRTAGLDRPVLVQYGAWLGRIATGDAGRSLLTGRPVQSEIAPRLRQTLLVGSLGALLALALATPAGIAAGVAPGSRLDRAVASVAALLASTPSFVLGSVLVAGLSVRLRWLPVAGDDTPWHFVLPVLALGAALTPGLALVVRHGVAGSVSAYYTTFARMLGVAPGRVALWVVARPALVPVVAYLPVLAMQFAEGFVAIELLFNLDGMGVLLVRSLLARDIPVVMGVGIALAGLLGVVTLLADLGLRVLDPRLRLAGHAP